MRFVAGALGVLTFTLFAASAHAQSALPPWPNPADLGRVLQGATSPTCPTVEVAPNVRIPVCANAMPKLPPGVVIPETVFGPLTIAASVDLRTRGLEGPVKNQQQTGVCWAFALSSVLESSLRRQGRGEVLSPLHIVAADSYSDLYRPRPNEAIDPEDRWPYDPIKACKLKTGADACERAYGVRTNTWRSDPMLVAERERAKSFGTAMIGHASALKRDPIDGITRALSTNRAVYLVLAIDSSAWSFGRARGGVLPEYEIGDRGDHAVTIVGYRTLGPSRQFLLHNSWGTTWGDGGYVWISEMGLRKHLTEAYLVDATPTGAFAAPALPFPQLPSVPQLPAWPWRLPA